MAVYLVTGGSGFIGSNIVEALIERNEVVRIYDNFSAGNLENIRSFQDKIELIQGDIRDLDRLREAVKGVDFVLHQAALSSVQRSIEDPLTTNRVNIDGTLNVLVAAKDTKVKRVVYASSAAVYGDAPKLPKREDMVPNPISPYGITKYTNEQYAMTFTSLYGLETVGLRYFNIFGPRQDPSSPYSGVISVFIKALCEHSPAFIAGDGKQSRDFTFVSNAVQANLLACYADGVAGDVFNIACGKRTTINQLAEKISQILKSDVKPEYTKPRLGDIRHSEADISKAKKILGYKPMVDLEEGLRRTIEWYMR